MSAGPIFYLCTCKQALGDDLRRNGCILWWCSPELCGCACHTLALRDTQDGAS